MTGRPAALIADVGGTNIRLAVIGADGAEQHVRQLRCDAYAGLAEAIEAYLEETAPDPRPDRAALAVASPVTGDRVELTNRGWTFSIDELRARLGWRRLDAINDFTAVALAVPRLGPDDRVPVGGGAPVEGAPVGVIGPGTGLGVSGLVPALGRWIALASEGGHATMAPADDAESAVLADLRARLGHVSCERVLSGQGLLNLYEAHARLAGEAPEPLTPEQVTGRALDGSCAQCAAAIDMFCGMLGTAAGNLALILGARGGVYIAGGIVPRLGERFLRSAFRERFEAKGRFAEYLAPVPVWVITREVPAFLGLAALLEDDAPGVPIAAREA